MREGVHLYTSEHLEKLWNKGFTTTGELTFESAAYVARYVMKKITGEQADIHYVKVNFETGELNQVEPEYSVMSRGGRTGRGIGYEWYEKFKRDTEKGFITVRGKKCRIPRYYEKFLMLEDTDLMVEMKNDREVQAKALAYDNTEERLAVKEKVITKKLTQLKRVIE